MASGARRMAEADIEAAAAMQVDAFGGVVSDVVERYHNGPRSTWRDAWVVDVDGEIRAAALAIPARWWFRGSVHDVSAIGAVAVRQIDRRRGYASALMHALLQAERDAGRPYSALYPFQHGFYRRLGYGSAGLMHFWRLPTAQIPDAPQLRSHVRLLRDGDRPAITELYGQWLPRHSGFERNPRQWERRWTIVEDRWVVYDDGSGVSGYLVYRTSGPTLDIRELVAATAEAERALWSFLASQVEQRSAVTYHAPIDDPLWAMLSGEPHMFEATNRGFVMTDAASLTISFMVRAVDLHAALSHRVYPSAVEGCVRLAVHDPVLPIEPLELTIEGGHATIAPSTADPDVRCDIVTLSQLLCGALTASQAHRFARLDATPDGLRLLDVAFPFGPPFIHPADWF